MTAPHMRKPVIAACCVVFAASTPAMAQLPDPIRVDNWLYFQRNTDNSGQWMMQPRVFIPVGLGHGWTFTQRLDVPVRYTDQSGTDNPTGTWKAGIGDWFIEEIFATPALADNLRMWGSVRFVFPTGGSGPFGSDQYQWAPALSLSYAMPEHGITFSPVARYFMSFHATAPSAAKIRKLTLFPTVSLGLPEKWTLSFYPENPISYDDVSHKWFVPIDLMLTKRVAKTVELGLGAAYALVDDDPLYRSMVYGRLTLYF